MRGRPHLVSNLGTTFINVPKPAQSKCLTWGLATLTEGAVGTVSCLRDHAQKPHEFHQISTLHEAKCSQTIKTMSYLILV